MSKKSKKKKKAKKKQLKKNSLPGGIKAESRAVLTEKNVIKEPEPEPKTPKIKKITKITTAIKAKKAVIKEQIQAKKFLIFESPDKIWGIVTILGTSLLALFIQYYVFNHFNPEEFQANAAQIKSQAQEAYKLSGVFDIIDTEKTNPGYYMGFGEEAKDIYSFSIKTAGNTVILKELTLTKTGNLPDGYLKNIKLYEGENAIAQAELKKDKLVFKKFTSVLQPDTEKKYVVKTDIISEGISGIRFKLSLVNPTDISIIADEDPVYALDTFPFEGAYATIVGWRKK